MKSKFSFKSLSLASAIIAAIFFSFALSSCDGDQDGLNPDLAHLDVYVYGTISKNPREGIIVTLHNTESEADRGVNAVVSSQITNEQGVARFKNLTPGRRYWVRAKALLIKNVEETDLLNKGLNDFDIDIL